MFGHRCPSVLASEFVDMTRYVHIIRQQISVADQLDSTGITLPQSNGLRCNQGRSDGTSGWEMPFLALVRLRRDTVGYTIS